MDKSSVLSSYFSLVELQMEQLSFSAHIQPRKGLYKPTFNNYMAIVSSFLTIHLTSYAFSSSLFPLPFLIPNLTAQTPAQTISLHVRIILLQCIQKDREWVRRKPVAFTVYCRVLLSLSYIQKSLNIARATIKRGYFQLLVKQTSVDSSTETTFAQSPHLSHMYSVFRWRSLEKLREKDINISKSYILQGFVPAEKAHIARLLQTFEHFGFGLMDNFKYIFC